MLLEEETIAEELKVLQTWVRKQPNIDLDLHDFIREIVHGGDLCVREVAYILSGVNPRSKYKRLAFDAHVSRRGLEFYSIIVEAMADCRLPNTWPITVAEWALQERKLGRLKDNVVKQLEYLVTKKSPFNLSLAEAVVKACRDAEVGETRGRRSDPGKADFQQFTDSCLSKNPKAKGNEIIREYVKEVGKLPVSARAAMTWIREVRAKKFVN